MPRRLFFWLAIFWGGSSFGQVDSLYTDTVVVQRAPHVIKKKFYVREPISGLQAVPMMGLQVGLTTQVGLGESMVHQPSMSVTGNAYHSFGLEIRQRLGSLEVGIGIGLSQFTHTITEQKDRLVTQTVPRMRVDTLDCYTLITPRGVITRCQTDTTYIPTEQTQLELYQESASHSVTYWQVPLSVGYAMNLGKWTLTPTALLVFGQLQHSKHAYRPTTWLLGGQLRLGYRLHAHCSAEIQGHFSSSLSAPTTFQRSWTLMGLGASIFYHF